LMMVFGVSCSLSGCGDLFSSNDNGNEDASASDTGTDLTTDSTSDADTDTDTDGDTDTDSDTDTDTDIDTDTDTDTDSDTDTDTDTDSNIDTDTAQCISDDTGNMGCEEYHMCIDSVCRPCGDNSHCGPLCQPCEGSTPVCDTGDLEDMVDNIESRCVCTEESCAEATLCDISEGICRACIDDDHCGLECKKCEGEKSHCTEVDGVGECWCKIDDTTGLDSCNPDGSSGLRCNTDTGDCEECIKDDACGLACGACIEDGKRVCDGTSGVGTLSQCVECVTHEDCRSINVVGVEKESPLGLCTPEYTCTCHISPVVPDGGELDLSWECNSTELDCPDGYTCALDYGLHSVCLRRCDPELYSSATNGMICESRNTDSTSSIDVWVPATSCFAFNKFLENADCESHRDCRVGGDTGDDAECVEDKCTYYCFESDTRDPNRCPNSTCGWPSNLCEHPQTD
jgi:hypothetical protein